MVRPVSSQSPNRFRLKTEARSGGAVPNLMEIEAVNSPKALGYASVELFHRYYLAMLGDDDATSLALYSDERGEHCDNRHTTAKSHSLGKGHGTGPCVLAERPLVRRGGARALNTPPTHRPAVDSSTIVGTFTPHREVYSASPPWKGQCGQGRLCSRGPWECVDSGVWRRVRR